MISDAQLMELSAKVGAKLKAGRRYLVTSESCTGGWIGKVLTDVPGSSDWYRGGVVVYSNALKEALVGVKSATLGAQGAVSEATAREMAIGALDTLDGDLAVAVTGIAGPNGGTLEKPVGTVWFAWALRSGNTTQVRVQREVFAGDRDAVRRASVERALAEVLSLDL